MTFDFTIELLSNALGTHGNSVGGWGFEPRVTRTVDNHSSSHIIFCGPQETKSQYRESGLMVLSSDFFLKLYYVGRQYAFRKKHPYNHGV